ncbi:MULTISPECIES: Hsp20/alpha crystallin family protein [Halobacterium]|uniref:Hsp20/alpha crystallin family protein n=1 Tax=Halobacterium TaxID=2239 RepID=UPI00073F79F3|nr:MULTISPECIES: Hsp20/alpha crystallin family protein [Halobacterium]MCG1004548.1 Hsp20/alpha crystallin family protein [Halobacterium noricense]
MDRNSPFDELERLLDKMNDARERAAGGLAVDVRDDEEAFVVTADLPGYEKDDIDVEVHERTLRIDARHEDESAVDDDNYVRRERSKRSLSRSVTLPEEVDESGATAGFENGVLTVELPKSHASEESTRVDIE